MKKQILRAFTMFSLLMMLAMATAMASAQTRSVKAYIPFNFNAGENKLAAGEYTIRRISQHALVIESADGKTRVMVVAARSIDQRLNQGAEKLVFHRYANSYFLSQVWAMRADSGRELDPTKSERAAAREMKQLAKSGSQKPETVEVAIGQ
ncbi:MAG: hypothetical protein WBP93_19405 [Pyrinomonadaceae bacterium]